MDNNHRDFNELWHRKSSTPPSLEELYSKIKSLKKSNRQNLILINFLMLATCFFAIFIWMYYQPELLSTKVGVIVTILAILIYLIPYNFVLKGFNKGFDAKSNRSQLEQLLIFKQKQEFMQTTMLSFYFMMLSVGIGLYMYEFAVDLSLFWTVVCYVVFTLWVLFNWFFLRVRIIRKQKVFFDGIINHLKKVINQFEY